MYPLYFNNGQAQSPVSRKKFVYDNYAQESHKTAKSTCIYEFLPMDGLAQHKKNMEKLFCSSKNLPTAKKYVLFYFI